VPGPHAAKIQLAPLGDLAIVDLTAAPLLPACRAAKRTIDVVLAGAVLLVALPVLFLAAIAIRVDSPGSWLFHQERVGADGRRFRMHKLRTMRTAEAGDRHRDYVAGMIDGTATQIDGLYKLVDDDRRTRVGRVLRKLSIDELPQLWNVLRGQMSIVGPRPALAQEVERYRPAALQRLAIKPGLTGLWQVSGRSRVSYDRMVELDAEYWQRWSLLLDLRILAKTPTTLLRGETA
jgi:lipopolysaccharide/colanic/teichoic acid biosynthesis glycosyltransferase